MIVPRHEPEVIASGAARSGSGRERTVATTSIKAILVEGVRITSRYGKAIELEAMGVALSRISARARAAIASMDCDSDAGHLYAVTLHEWDPSLARLVGTELQRAFLKGPGGHNGIRVGHGDADLGPEEGYEVAAGWLRGGGGVAG